MPRKLSNFEVPYEKSAMLITRSYIGMTRGNTCCLFFLLFEDYLEAQRELQGQLDEEIGRFARNLEDAGAVVEPFPECADAVMKNVLNKPWSESQLAEVHKTPAMLMIDRDFDEFDPRYHPWELFHFGRKLSARQNINDEATQIRSLFQQLTKAATRTETDAFTVVRNASLNNAITNASKSFQLQPGMFGVSVDLKACWGALKGALKQYLR
ncbi:MAG: hypothetical protein BRC49_00005 [Cyanobacteria bacterium SW_10_48_33]|nr:MAG: hypothetical protein BRC49_00005 [Cyanobacteria bacterium SW_10_48_33]